MTGHHIKPSSDKLQRDERWKELMPRVRKFMADRSMSGRMLADELGLTPATTNKWLTVDCPTTPKNEIMDELEALIHED